MELDEPWGRIVAWLTAYAPASAAQLRPPAPAAALAAAREAFARPWPAELVRFYELTDGVDDSFVAPLIPMAFGPLPVERVVSGSRMMVSVFEGLRDDGVLGEDHLTVDEAERMLAGSRVGQWIPSYLMVADDSMGHSIVVDLRAGPESGTVFEWMHEGADDTIARWPSLTLLLDEIATALEDGTDVGEWTPSVTDGGDLHWDMP